MRPLATLLLSLLAASAVAHPGHLAFDADHVHGSWEIEPLLMFALAAASAVLVAALVVRRSRLRSRS